MAHAGARTAAGLVALVLVWIVVYWLWQPGALRPDPRITFAPPAEPAGPRPGEGAEAFDPPEATPRPHVVDPTTVVVPPAFRDYTVRDGDTFEVIARRELGSRSLWTAIAQANPLRDPRRLRAGDVIRIPLDPRNVQGAAPDGSAPPAPEPISPADETTIVYLVKAGDSLSSIAQAYYGSQKHSEFIFRNNRDVLNSMDDLSIGMQLRLPPAPPD